MTTRLVHFATNRLWNRGAGRFGEGCDVPGSRLWLGTTGVEVMPDPMRDGTVGQPDVCGFDDFAGPADGDGAAAGVVAAWLAAARQRGAIPLLTVHGFDYDFTEACGRAGNFCDVIEATTGLRLEPLAFAWPSRGLTTLDAYKLDQVDCANSGEALARLIRAIALATAGTAPKPVYLAHSMGARATRFGMVALAQGPEPMPRRVFAQAVIIAGDDDTDVLAPGHGPLRPLLDLADYTTIGVYRQDATLAFISARLENIRDRLGAHGPDPMPQPHESCFVVDYGYVVSLKPELAGIADWNYVGHQYYRTDPRVLQDLAAALRGDTPPDKVAGRRLARPDPSIAFPEHAGRYYVLPDPGTAFVPLADRGALGD